MYDMSYDLFSMLSFSIFSSALLCVLTLFTESVVTGGTALQVKERMNPEQGNCIYSE